MAQHPIPHAGSAALTPAPLAAAIAAPLRPGFWEIRTRPEAVGIPMISAPRVTRHCFSTTGLASGALSLPLAPVCKAVEGGEWRAGQLLLKIECEGAPPGASLTGSVAPQGPEAFTGQAVLIQQPHESGAARVEMRYHHQGRWLGDTCPAPRMMTPQGPVY